MGRTCIMQVLPIFAVYNFLQGFSAASVILPGELYNVIETLPDNF